MAAEVEHWNLQLPEDHMARSTELPWYTADVEKKLKPSFRKLLEEWSGIAPESVVSHIYQTRDESWKVFPWPCIGEFWFIEQSLLRHPDYAATLARLKESGGDAKFLDLGTCLGQDVRTLAYDGAPISSLYGADALPKFEAAGHALFKDNDRFDSSHFITGDISSDSDALAQTRGTWDIVHIAMFLHIFSLEDQKVASQNVLKLLKTGPGSAVIGTQTGSLDPGELQLKPPMCEPGENRTIFRQSKDTLKHLWESAAKAVGLEVKVWTEYDEAEGEHWQEKERFFVGDKERNIFFKVEIV